MKLLLTGFGPFPGVPVNPAELIVRRLCQQGPGLSASNATLAPWEETHCRVLPVEYGAGGDAVVRLLKDRSPDMLLLLGVKSAGSGTSLERFALNVDDCTVPDAAGVVREGQAIREGGADALQTRVKLGGLRDAMAARDYRLDISNHAGTYLCNHVYYRALDFVAASSHATRVLFVHVPMPVPLNSHGLLQQGSLGYLEGAVRELIRVLPSFM